MTIQYFHSLLSRELEAIKTSLQSESMKGNEEQKNSYVFLLWFLRFYADKPPHNSHQQDTTEGRGDHSFDAIVDLHSQTGEKVYCFVQSKYKQFKEKGYKTEALDKDEFLRFLQEVQSILSGTIPQDANEKVKQKLALVHEHRRKNGRLKCVFLTAHVHTEETKTALKNNVAVFERENPLVFVEIIDINRLRTDYINKHLKGISSPSPLLAHYDPKKEKIHLPVGQPSGSLSNFLHLSSPYPAYSLLIRPHLLFELFEKYGTSLFFENVRNPLLTSLINEQIVKTAIETPDWFYYYNNGITALVNEISEHTKPLHELQVTGLQVINGAQTLYSIYYAYQQYPQERDKMDRELFIPLRLIRSNNSPLNLNITRYTNSQNPINERDFWANDPIQERLQQQFYDLGLLYEKRAGEFRENPENLPILSNAQLVGAYAAFVLQQPHLLHLEKPIYFKSQEDGGRYERIFNEKTQAEALLLSWRIANLFEDIQKLPLFLPFTAHAVALSFLVLKRYYLLKYSENNVVEKLSKWGDEQQKIAAQALFYALKFINEQAPNFSPLQPDDEALYEKIVDKWQSSPFDIDKITQCTD